MIRVLVVDDSIVVRKTLCEVLESDNDIEVVGFASNGHEAVQKVKELKPDIITMDIHMPVLSGINAISEIMAYTPLPILIITSTAYFQDKENIVYKALSLGALDVIKKPEITDWDHLEKSGKKLINKIKLLSKVKVIRHMKGFRRHVIKVRRSSHIAKNIVVAIASSTGGPKALHNILSSFSSEFPAAILIVQHIAEGFVEGLASWLDEECDIKVRIGKNGEHIDPSTCYIAPSCYHMIIDNRAKIRLVDEPPINGLKPSCDYLLNSVGEVFRGNAIGIIMTGMGSDGAKGIKTIKDNGGLTIAQDEATSVVFGMPSVAIQLNAIDRVLPLNKIAEEIISQINKIQKVINNKVIK